MDADQHDLEGERGVRPDHDRVRDADAVPALGREPGLRDRVACGRDPFFPPWRDVAQLNYFNPATREAMIEVGDRISWPYPIVADKHSVGGLPGNRTTMIVVPIVAACGLTMPKTSSRAITSPAG